MKQKSLILSLLFFAAIASLQAQVTIGSTDTPTDGAVLDLSKVPSGEKLGLILPTVTLTGSTTYQLGTTFANEEKYPDAAGTVVFHVGSAALRAGLYVWDGDNWLAAGGTVQLPGTLQVGSNTYTTGYFGSAGWWMTENLREIPVGGEFGVGADPDKRYYNYPDNHVATVDQYGYLYSWTAAMNLDASDQTTPIDYTVDLGNNSGQTPVQGICPDGWHLPTDYEWSQLESEIATNRTQAYSTIAEATTTSDKNFYTTIGYYRGATPEASSLDKKMKANQIWHSNDGSSKAASEGGFSALPAGLWTGWADGFEMDAYFWSSSSSGFGVAWYRYLTASDSGVLRHEEVKTYQFSVRCKKN
ncbi:hypothetical protein FACS1894176_02120 [Bacteroidia bacterium]|nr:hypothetical protein FACS1894176_02120 [Bacteroidia bacterium]